MIVPLISSKCECHVFLKLFSRYNVKPLFGSLFYASKTICLKKGLIENDFMRMFPLCYEYVMILNEK
jgi:hypothetical protein